MQNQLSSFSFLFLTLFIGIANLICYFFAYSVPIVISSIELIFLLTIVGILFFEKKTSVLSTLGIITFSIPFIHVLEYVFFDFNSTPQWLWGLATNPYMLDQRIIELMASFGVTGTAGFLSGILFLSLKSQNQNLIELNSNDKQFTRLSMFSTSILIFFGMLMMIISSSKQTMFSNFYGYSEVWHQSLNFNSAWSVGLIGLTFAFSDAWLDRANNSGKTKRFLCWCSIVCVVLFLQLLNGDREGLPWVIAIASVGIIGSRIFSDLSHYRINILKVGIFIFVLLALNFVVGVLRTNSVGVNPFFVFQHAFHLLDIYDYDFTNLFSGTWSASLLTPLSVAGDHIEYGTLFLWGRDYYELLMSMPPGFVADFFQYSRPIDANSSPAWEMRYGMGGTHALVLPFRNFSMVGVFLIPILYGLFVKSVENKIEREISVSKLSLVITLISTLPHWLWYGEKYLMNALIIWFVYKILYSILLFSQKFYYLLKSESQGENHISR